MHMSGQVPLGGAPNPRRSRVPGAPVFPRKVQGLVGAMERCAAGDEGALAEWMEEGYPHLLGACVRWSGDPELGQRLACGIVRAAFHHARTRPAPTHELAWLRAVARRTYMELLRRDRPGGEPLPGDPTDQVEDPSGVVEREDLRRAVQEVIDALPVKHRLPMHLRYVRGATEAEVAGWVWLWTGVGRQQTHRILRQGREMVELALRGGDPRMRWPQRFRVEGRWRRPPPPFPHRDGPMSSSGP